MHLFVYSVYKIISSDNDVIFEEFSLICYIFRKNVSIKVI